MLTTYGEKRILVTSPNKEATPSIAILMCTYNGDRFLTEQLDSIFKQDHSNTLLYVSDDGSSDNTVTILKKYQALWGADRFFIVEGPQQGFAENFLSLICNPDIQADYYALSDQDDIWEPKKLSRALERLISHPDAEPNLYCARTQLVNEQGKTLGLSPLFNKPPCFKNALMQSIGGGNTMVMNHSAINCLRSAGERKIISHDWWAYLVISGAGGTIIYDPETNLLYRQHGSNIIGSNVGFRALLMRAIMLLKGKFREWNTINIRALKESQSILTPENQATLDTFCLIRESSLVPRVLRFLRSNFKRQTLLGNIGLLVATVFKKL